MRPPCWAIEARPRLERPTTKHVSGLDQDDTMAIVRAAVVQAASDTGYYLITLGVARYRVGDYANALQTLTQSEKLNWTMKGPHPADVAFLAMAQHQLRKKDEAQATLARLREILKQPGWAKDAEAQGFLGEAETLINGGQPGQD